jgi:SAM-dependent methyltransferase
MGLGGQAIEAIAREHKYKPVAGDVLFVGRQMVGVSPEELATKLREAGNDVNAGAIAIDRTTINRPRGVPHELPTDRSIFHALGVRNVKAIDVSAYEGAEIVHDLNVALPPQLEGVADFLVDGSTLDNVFDPAMVLRNYARLLRPGGRLIAVNAFNTIESAYTLCSPHWYLDFFVVNGFADCRVYFGTARRGQHNVFWLDPGFWAEREQGWTAFRDTGPGYVLLFAEKGADSRADRTPIQQHYRGAEQRREYLERCRAIRGSTRPHLARSTTRPFVIPASGFFYLDREYRHHTFLPVTLRLLPQRALLKAYRTYRQLRSAQ